MDMVNIKINGMSYEVAAGSTILEAAREAGIDIPTLCFLKDVNQIGACRMCMVEVKGAKSLVAACVYPVNEGMEVFTNTPKVQKSRKMTLELLLSVHDRKCLSCKRSGTCELQKLCNDMGIDSENRYEGAVPAGKKDYSTLHLERDNAKCILCRRCVAVCRNVQKIGAIGAVNRGFMNNDQRYAGYCDALEEAGITPNPENLITNLFPFKAERGIALGRQLAAQRAITGVCVSGDQYAAAVITGLREGGARVPEDISIVGFDDVDIARMTFPPLTTIHQDGIGKGRRAAEAGASVTAGRNAVKSIY